MLLINGFVVAFLMLSLWFFSLRLQDASIVDVFWGLGFVLIAWNCALFTEEISFRGWMALLFITVWGIRLTIHLGVRKWGESEDHRYREMREHYGHNFWWVSFYLVFGLQGLVMWIVSLPVQTTISSSIPINGLDVFGMAVWVGGMMFEVISDAQLAIWKKNPENHGKVLRSGLWKYSRHPNYFGECLLWWGFYLFAASASPWWVVVSPLLLTWLLLKVSGVAMLDRTQKVRKPEYQDYINSTSAFVPWFPSQSSIK